MNESSIKDGPQAAAVGGGAARVWGMTGAQRLERQFRRAGLTPVAAEALADDRAAVVARADWVFDEGLIKALADEPGAALTAPDGQAVAAHAPAGRARETAEALAAGRAIELRPIDPAALAYNNALRKREPPLLTTLAEDSVRAVEAKLFGASYKGVTDLVTKYAWPVPARIVTRWCALAGITPNQVTFAGFILVIAAFWLFWEGHFGWGLACGWVMTFLDTVDGKLARVTLTSSKFGNIFDHGIDLIHPPFWWWAWFVGLQMVDKTPPWPELSLWVILAGYVLQRVEEGVFMRLYGFHVHSWRPFDSFFRLITARRNPNLIMLTLAWLAGRPDLGFLAVAVWTGICLLVHLAQVVQAMAMPRGQVVSWLAR